MKKVVTNGEDITFAVTSALVLDITKEGVIVADDVAKVLEDRLGVQVTISQVNVKEAAEAASHVVNSDPLDGPVVPTEKMNTENLTLLAKAEGATDEQLGECKKKADIVALILANREAPPATDGAGDAQ